MKKTRRILSGAIGRENTVSSAIKGIFYKLANAIGTASADLDELRGYPTGINSRLINGGVVHIQDETLDIRGGSTAQNWATTTCVASLYDQHFTTDATLLLDTVTGGSVYVQPNLEGRGDAYMGQVTHVDSEAVVVASVPDGSSVTRQVLNNSSAASTAPFSVSISGSGISKTSAGSITTPFLTPSPGGAYGLEFADAPCGSYIQFEDLLGSGITPAGNLTGAIKFTDEEVADDVFLRVQLLDTATGAPFGNAVDLDERAGVLLGHSDGWQNFCIPLEFFGIDGADTKGVQFRVVGKGADDTISCYLDKIEFQAGYELNLPFRTLGGGGGGGGGAVDLTPYLRKDGTVALTNNWNVGGFDITAGTFIGALSGNATTASAWATPRTVTFATGDVTGNFSIDGSSNVSNVNLQVADNSHNHTLSNISDAGTAITLDYVTGNGNTTTNAVTVGTFTSTGIADLATTGRFELYDDSAKWGSTSLGSDFGLTTKDNDVSFYISGGITSSSGSFARFFGNSHPTKASDIVIGHSGGPQLDYDSSTSEWSFHTNDIKTSGDIHSTDTNSEVTYSGGSSGDLGANVRLFGEAHATNADDMQFRSDTTLELEFDASANLWDFQSNDIRAGGKVVAGNDTLTVDNQFYMGASGADTPAIFWAVSDNDYQDYIRSSNIYRWQIANTVEMSLSASTLDLATNDIRLGGNIDFDVFDRGIDWSQSQTSTTATGATTESEILHNYEEGTWTPVLTDGTNDATMAAGTDGTYTRIGRTIFFGCRLVVSSLGSVSGSVYVKGLPFVQHSRANEDGGAWAPTGNNLSIGAGQVVSGDITNGQSRIALRLWDSTAGTTAMQASEFTASGQLRLVGQYFAAT